MKSLKYDEFAPNARLCHLIWLPSAPEIVFKHKHDPFFSLRSPYCLPMLSVSIVGLGMGGMLRDPWVYPLGIRYGWDVKGSLGLSSSYKDNC